MAELTPTRRMPRGRASPAFPQDRRGGIGAGIHYPVPVHLTAAFSRLGYPQGSFPVTEQAAGAILSLPLFAEITVEQQARVVSVLISALK